MTKTSLAGVEREDTPTIMDGLVVRYRLWGSGAGGFEISASRNGVVVGGYSPTCGLEQVDAIRLVLWWCARQFDVLQQRGAEPIEQTILDEEGYGQLPQASAITKPVSGAHRA
jgi:hypothetical protein